MQVDSTSFSRSFPNKRARSPQNAGSSSSSSSESDSDSDWSELDEAASHWLSKDEKKRADEKRRLRAEYKSRQHGGRKAREVTPEAITSKTPLNDNNVGMRMLRLMGWSGGGLGAQGTGRTEPIPLPDKMDSMGLGRAYIETRMLEDLLTKRPKVLESQRIATETDEQRLARETAVADKAARSTIIQETLNKFFCDICNKGYKKVGEWEEHLQSYGHNHAKRKKEIALQNKQAMNSQAEVDKRREKEKRREQKELERMLKAAGGSGSAFPGGAGPSTSVQAKASTESATSAVSTPPAVEKKKGGFFKVSTSTSGSAPPLPSANAPLPPPPSSLPPPPPMPDGPAPPPPSTALPSKAAPRFTSSSSLASTFTRDSAAITATSTLPVASRWKPSTAPGLHPLLAGSTEVPAVPAKSERNDFFRRPEEPTDSPYELPTAASSTNTKRAPKGINFIASGSTVRPDATSVETVAPTISTTSVSLGGPAQRKKLLDMQDDDEDDTVGSALPTGRPKAKMPTQAARGGKAFGFGKLG